MQILIIEDDDRTAGFVTAAFRQVGYGATRVADGEAGLSAAMEGAFDAAVVDIMLPKLDGIELIRRLRVAGNTLPIIVLSARSSVEDKIRGLEAGGDDYLAKPFSVAELVARVQTIMRRGKGTAESSVLKAGDLEMDLVSHRVHRGGREIDLQPLEYQLLEYLLRNQGRVVTRATIMESVWHYAYDPCTNVVQARMSRLREKIDDGSGRELIKTVRGFGYVLS